jgi:hypothetical protein
LLVPAGIPLKGNVTSAIYDLADGRRPDWLGYVVGWHEGALTAQIGDRAWSNLEQNLTQAHGQPNSPLRADDTVRGWLGQAGPCLPHEDRRAACRRIEKLAASQGFDEIPGVDALLELWEGACDRWQTRVAASQSGEPMVADDDAEVEDFDLQGAPF